MRALGAPPPLPPLVVRGPDRPPLARPQPSGVPRPTYHAWSEVSPSLCARRRAAAPGRGHGRQRGAQRGAAARMAGEGGGGCLPACVRGVETGEGELRPFSEPAHSPTHPAPKQPRRPGARESLLSPNPPVPKRSPPLLGDPPLLLAIHALRAGYGAILRARGPPRRRRGRSRGERSLLGAPGRGARAARQPRASSCALAASASPSSSLSVFFFFPLSSFPKPEAVTKDLTSPAREHD